MPVAPKPHSESEPSWEDVTGSAEGIDSEKREEGPDRPSGVRNHFSNFVKWVGELIFEQAQAEAHMLRSPVSAKRRRDISVQHRHEEVIEVAKKISMELEEIKQKLSGEFGASSAMFIAKCIDPMIGQVKGVIANLSNSENHKVENFQDLLEQAVASVELYSQFSDEKKLRKKVVHEAQLLVQQAINKDIEILENYKTHAIVDFSSSSEEYNERKRQLDRFLLPIMQELKDMLQFQVEDDEDLHAFFVLKTNIDDRRSSIVELGLLTTDAVISQFTGKGSQPAEKRPVDEFEEAQVEAHVALHLHNLSIIAILEDRVNGLQVLINGTPDGDEKSFQLLEELSNDLKFELNRFSSLGHTSARVVQDCSDLFDRIREAEELLQLRRQGQ